jgi:hypothetical protein
MRGGVVSVKAGAPSSPGTTPPLCDARKAAEAEEREGDDILPPLLTPLRAPVKA